MNIRQRLPFTAYLFLLPALLGLSLTVFVPALQAFYLSFTNFNLLTGDAPWAGLANFDRLLKDGLFWKTVGNTLLYLLVAVPLLTVLLS